MTSPERPLVQLYVPGDRPDRFDRAAASGADIVILDLEDAVPAQHRGRALDAVIDWLSVRPVDAPAQAWVRVNAGAEHEVIRLRSVAGLGGIVIPKAGSREDLDVVRRHAPDVAIAPLIESASGIAAMSEIATFSGVAWLHLGELDLAADIRLNPRTGRELDPIRLMLVIASRLAGLAPPPVPVHSETLDLEAYATWTRSIIDLGFRGSTCIHPRQVDIARRAWQANVGDLEWAKRVLAAAKEQGAAFLFEGSFIDEPTLKRARAVLEDGAN